MFLAFMIIEVGVLIVIFSIRFVISDDMKGRGTWKQWFNSQGIALMLLALLPGRSAPWRFHYTLFITGAVAFLLNAFGWPRGHKGDGERGRGDDDLN